MNQPRPRKAFVFSVAHVERHPQQNDAYKKKLHTQEAVGVVGLFCGPNSRSGHVEPVIFKPPAGSICLDCSVKQYQCQTLKTQSNRV